MRLARHRAGAGADVARAQALDGPDVDALLQVGTALRRVAIAAEAERWFNKPVLAINAVTYWDALCAAAASKTASRATMANSGGNFSR